MDERLIRERSGRKELEIARGTGQASARTGFSEMSIICQERRVAWNCLEWLPLCWSPGALVGG